jgi:peptide/nickel transport system permease protein
MPFQPSPLFTDVLLWLLMAAIAFYARYCSRRPHLAVPWKRVFQSKAAVICSVMLAVFVAIGFLDSLHFRPRLQGAEAHYSPEVLSVLDLALSHVRDRRERTYSAPLATSLYAKEQVQVDGKTVRDFPRLRYGGSHLKNDADWASDVGWRIGAGLLLAGVAFFFLRKIGTAGVTLAAMLAVALPVAFLAHGYHVFGTDKVGQDVLYQSLKSIRISLVIGTLTTLVLLPVGVALGIAAGYFKGWIDDAIQYVYTTLNSIPGVLLIAAAVLMMQVVIDRNADWFATAALRADFRLLILCAILGLTSWTGLARLLRGEALKLSQLEYIQAAHAFGVADTRILGRHILPNVAHIVIIAMVMDFSGLVLAEAVLSYVGVGVDPATTSFGTMINAARLEMGREPIVWWSLAAAFIFMFVLVLAANLFADAVRDGFDPRVRV